MFLKALLLSVLFVAFGGFLFWVIYRMAVHDRREQIKMVARWELQDEMSESITSAPSLLNKSKKWEMNEDEKLYELTESGQRLKKIDEDGKWVMMIGALVALVVVVCYWRFYV